MKKDPLANTETPKKDSVSLLIKDRDVVIAYLESLNLPVGQAREMIKIIDFLKGLK